MSWDFKSFKEKLENEHSFPGLYIFKFIVPLENEQEIRNILPEGEISSRKSSKGTYTSVTAKSIVASSDEVMDIYLKASKVQGVIAL